LESDTKHSPFHAACSNSSPVTISFFSKSTCKGILLAGSTKTLTSDKNCGKGQSRCIPYSSKITADSVSTRISSCPKGSQYVQFLTKSKLSCSCEKFGCVATGTAENAECSTGCISSELHFSTTNCCPKYLDMRSPKGRVACVINIEAMVINQKSIHPACAPCDLIY